MSVETLFLTENFDNIKWPEWFVNKYKNICYFKENKRGYIYSKCLIKIDRYTNEKLFKEGKDLDQELTIDISKVLIEINFELDFHLIYLHETNNITKVVINKNNIKYYETLDWEEVPFPRCYY